MQGVVDLQPGPGGQAHGIQSDVVGERLPAGSEQRLVGLHFAVIFEGQGDRAGAARAAFPGDGDADPHVYSGLCHALAISTPTPPRWLSPRDVVAVSDRRRSVIA